jgi:molybdopterin-binding protein
MIHGRNGQGRRGSAGLRTQEVPTMKIGARNRLEAEVIEVKRGAVMCQVRVQLAGGAQMESVMTIDSLEEMGLKVGDRVRVAVKAVNVLLIKE